MINEHLEIKRLNSEDVNSFKELIKLFQNVFEHETDLIPADNYLIDLLKQTDFVVFTATIKNKLVGGLTAYELKKYYLKESELFIYDIAINPDFQRNGLGKELISTIKTYAKSKGIGEIFVAAHKEDKQAVNFYHSTNREAEKVIHFNYSLEEKGINPIITKYEFHSSKSTTY